MTRIDFYADGQRLKIIEEKPLIVEKSLNEYEAVFTFSDDWEGITEKNAVFRRFSDNKAFTVGLDEKNMCLIPWEVLKAPRFYVSAYGGNLRTMTELYLNVEKTGYDENAEQSGTVPQPNPVPTGLKIENNKLQLTAKGEAVGEGVTLPEITVDTELSDTSENAVQNKAVKAYIDETAQDYIKNRPFYTKWETADSVTLFVNDMIYDGMGLYGKRLGLSVGTSYTVDLLSVNGETVTQTVECTDGAESIGMTGEVIPIMVINNDTMVYDNITVGSDGNPICADNAVFAIDTSFKSITIHGSNLNRKTVKRLSNEYLNVDLVYDENSTNPQSGVAVYNGISKAFETFSLDGSRINYKSIPTDKLSDNAVTTVKIADKAITANKIADKAITTEKISDYGISSKKISNNAVKTQHIEDYSITGKKLEKPTLRSKTIVSEAVEVVGFTSCFNSRKKINIRGKIKSTSSDTSQTLIVNYSKNTNYDFGTLVKIPLDFSNTDNWEFDIRLTKEIPIEELKNERLIKAEGTVWINSGGINETRKYYNFGSIELVNNDPQNIYISFGDVTTQLIASGSEIYMITVQTL